MHCFSLKDLDVIYSAPEIASVAGGNASVDVLEGDQVRVGCEATGIPDPEVSWVRRGDGGVRLTSAPSSATLVLKSATTREDEGRYACVAANEYGSDAAEVDVNVYRRIRFRGKAITVSHKYVTVDLQYTCRRFIRFCTSCCLFLLLQVLPLSFFKGAPKDVVATSMEDIRLPCDLEIDPRLTPTTDVAWTKDGHPLDVSSSSSSSITFSESDFSLTLRRVMRPSSQGDYACAASERRTGASARRTTRLTVLGEPPEFIATEKDVR